MFEKIYIYLGFQLFLKTEMAQVVEILPDRRHIKTITAQASVTIVSNLSSQNISVSAPEGLKFCEIEQKYIGMNDDVSTFAQLPMQPEWLTQFTNCLRKSLISI